MAAANRCMRPSFLYAWRRGPAVYRSREYFYYISVLIAVCNCVDNRVKVSRRTGMTQNSHRGHIAAYALPGQSPGYSTQET